MQVGVDVVSGEPCVDGGLCFGAVLDFDEGAEPCAEEEDFPVLLDVWKVVERACQVRLRQGCLIPCIEGAQALRDPVFLDGLGVQILIEVPCFDIG